MRITSLATGTLLLFSASLALPEDATRKADEPAQKIDAAPQKVEEAPQKTAATPMTEAAYREAAGKWNDLWQGRPPLTRRDEDSCIAAWQTGDRVRTLMRDATPPAALEAYHTAVLECIEASLAVSDECLLKPNGGPNWGRYFLTARKTCPRAARIVNVGRLDLPRSW